MKKNKIKIGLIFGGKSGEHEISLISSWNIFHGFDKEKYEVFLIGIDKSGTWHFCKDEKIWINPKNPKEVSLNIKTPIVTIARKKNNVCIIDLVSGKNVAIVDVFFPITHGTYGEDGCLQGMLEMMDAPFVGPGVLGSAVGMDKDIMKRLLRDGGVAISKFHVLRSNDIVAKKLSSIISDLKFPIFVKPASLGSSVGISKAENKKELLSAISLAFQYDIKIILEQAIVGREIECSVLGNEKLLASIPGEIQLKKGFYSFSAKYIDNETATVVLQAKISKIIAKRIKDLAIKVFNILECEGLGRVDFFLTANNKIFVNEINTLPGFTSISMYPKMLENSGIKYVELLDRLICLALDRKEKRSYLRRNSKA